MTSYDNVHQGWATVGGQTCWFRSKWEFNIAHILEHWKQTAKCWNWQHEPDIHYLHGVKKGEHKQYIPDFKIWTSNESFYYMEIKGKYPAKDKRRMENFKKQYPQYLVEVIREKKYKELLEQYKKFVPIIPFP